MRLSPDFSETEAIRIDGVSHAFAGTSVLREVSFGVRQGERLAIVGESGAGKSTLLRCLNLLTRPVRGTITINGLEWSALGESALSHARRDVGMIFQHFALLKRRTVRDNIALPLELAGMARSEIDARVEGLLKRVWLEDKADAWPGELSGGQRQRVGIARALAHGPSILLCDEPTSALDTRTAQQIVELLNALSADLALTLVLVTHQLEVVRRCADRVAVLEGGVLRELSCVDAFFSQPTSVAGRRLLAPAFEAALPYHLVSEARSRLGVGGSTLLSIGLGAQTPRAVVFETLVARYGLAVDVVGANVETVRGTPVGQLAMLVSGEPSNIHAALRALEAHHIAVEVMGHVSPALQWASERIVRRLSRGARS